jgi:hypothetical protein
MTAGRLAPQYTKARSSGEPTMTVASSWQHRRAAGFGICAEELSSIVEGHDVKKLKSHGGVQGLASKLSTSESDGLAMSADKLATWRDDFGVK